MAYVGVDRRLLVNATGQVSVSDFPETQQTDPSTIVNLLTDIQNGPGDCSANGPVPQEYEPGKPIGSGAQWTG